MIHAGEIGKREDLYLECGFLVRRRAVAQEVYAQNARLVREKAPAGTLPLNPHIGDQSVMEGLHQNDAASYSLVFRRGNAILRLGYVATSGTPPLSLSAFVRLGAKLDSRLK